MPAIFDAAEHTLAKTTGHKEVMPEKKQNSLNKKRAADYSQIIREDGHRNNSFFSYAVQPNQVSFDSQLENEDVLVLLRRHPITQIRWIVIAVAMAFLPFLFSYVSLFDFLPLRFQMAALLGWYLLVIGFCLEMFLNWFFNVYIITDERVIDVDFLSLIYKNISAARIENIEDITTTTSGTLQSVFNFGTIKIQTAAAVTEIEFEDVPQPARITTLLNELLLEEEQEKIDGRVQ